MSEDDNSQDDAASTAMRILDAVPVGNADELEQAASRMDRVLMRPLELTGEGDSLTADIGPIVYPAVLVASVAVDYISAKLGIEREEALFDIRSRILAHSGVG